MGKTKPLRKIFPQDLSKELLHLRIKYPVPIPSTDDEPCIQDILPMIDSPVFLLALPKIREKLGIKKVPFKSPHDLIMHIFDTFRHASNLPDLLETPKDSLGHFLSNPTHWKDILDLWSPIKNTKGSKRHILDYELLKLQLEFGDKYFSYEIAEQAVLLGMVGWGVKPYVAIHEAYPLRTPTFVIPVYRRTRKKDVLKLFSKIKQDFFSHTKITKVPKIIKYHRLYWNYLEFHSLKKTTDKAAIIGKDQLDSATARDIRNYINMLVFPQVI